jgi:hypothetical protein
MELLVRVSVWLYRGLLLVYPRELRSHFDVDMTEGFEDLLRKGADAAGPAGIAAIGSTALVELAVAAPARLQSKVIIATGLSFVVSSPSTWVFLRAVG